MNPNDENIAALAREIAESEVKLQMLEAEIEEIGQPAAHDLKRRLEALKVEENALKRNLAEALDIEGPDSARMEKVKSLLHYIESEEAAVAHDADFLYQAAPTSSEMAAKAGIHLLDLCLRALKRVVGDHHPLGMSVFVNHSRENLKSLYGLNDTEADDLPPRAGDT